MSTSFDELPPPAGPAAAAEQEEDDNLLILRMPSMDSSIAFSESSSVLGNDPWICPQCSYSNVDSQNARCALCGQTDAVHSQKVKKHNTRKSSWLSLSSITSIGSFGNNNNSNNNNSTLPPPQPPVAEEEEEEEEKEEDEVMPSPVQDNRKQTSIGLPPSTMSVRRPDREHSAGDIDPEISLPDRSNHSPVGEKRSMVLESPVSSHHSRSEQRLLSPDTSSSDEQSTHTRNTSHSRDPTVRTSNRVVPPPLLDDSPPPTPPTSNKSMSISSRSMDASHRSVGSQRSAGSASTRSVGNRSTKSMNSQKSTERSVSAPPPPVQGHEPLPALRHYHSDTSSNKSNNRLPPGFKQPHLDDDIEQASYLPATMMARRGGHPMPGSSRGGGPSAGTSSTQLVPPVRKASMPVPDDGAATAAKTTKKKKRSKTKNNGSSSAASRSSQDPQANASVSSKTNIAVASVPVQQQHMDEKTKNVSAHTQKTHRTSFTSSFADEMSVEVEPESSMPRQAPIPLEVAAGDGFYNNNNHNHHESQPRGGGISKNRRLQFIILLGIAMLIVAVVVGVIVAVTVGKKNKNNESPLVAGPQPTVETTPAPTTAPTVSPTQTTTTTAPTPAPVAAGEDMLTIRPISTALGMVEERSLGRSVSVGGPRSRWAAMGGSDFVRVVGPTLGNVGGNVQPIGNRIKYDAEKRGLVEVSLAQVNLVATAWEGKLTVHELSGQEWLETCSYESGGKIVSTVISGGGNVVAFATFLPEEDQILVGFVDPFDCEGIPPERPSLVVPASSMQPIQLRLSHDGNTIVILSAGNVKSYCYKDDPDGWEEIDIVSPILNLSNLGALALSMNGRVFAVADASQTTVFIYRETSKVWVPQSEIEQGAQDLALDHSGSLLAVANLGTVAVFERKGSDTQYTTVMPILEEADSGFGTSVALGTTTENHSMLAVGAPAYSDDKDSIGDHAGMVHLYSLSNDTGK